MFYYLDKEKLFQGKIFVLMITNESNKELKQKYFEYEGENLPKYPIYSNGILREATKFEQIQLGYTELQSWEYIENNTVKEKPLAPNTLVKPVWNNILFKWEEGATQEEIEDFKKNLSIEFYKSEKEYFELAELDFKEGFITEEEFNGLIPYMRSINPFYPAIIPHLTRPKLFDRYKI